jgi:hypothetical protein
MIGGEISNNISHENGGGVHLQAHSIFTMTSGKISGNNAYKNGGGVYMGSGRMDFCLDDPDLPGVNGINLFIMNDGEISGNTAIYHGGGVYVGDFNIFNQSGGVVAGAGTGISDVINTVADARYDFNIGQSPPIVPVIPISPCIIPTLTSNFDINFNDYPTPNNGVVIVWDRPSGAAPYVYAVDTDTDLTVSPSATSTAVWAKDGSDFGVSYANGVNAGFVKILGTGDVSAPITTEIKTVATADDFYAQVAAYATAGGHVVIEVGQNLTLNRRVSVPALATFGRTLTIRSVNPAAPVTLTRGVAGNLFAVHIRARLILENVIIDGGTGGGFANSFGSLMHVNGGSSLVMKSGAVMRNNRTADAVSLNSFGSGAVRIFGGGMFTMDGGEIRGVAGAGSVFVVNDGALFTMNGGKISGNTVGGFGGVTVIRGGTFIMDGGEISGNTGRGFGSGVHVSDRGSLFTMTNGKISGNTAPDGGGVYVSTDAEFIMSNGEISGNTAATRGGGVYVGGGVFNMGGGKIVSNIVTTPFASEYNGGSGAYVQGGTLIMSGGEISSGTYNQNGAVVYVMNHGWIDDAIGTFTMTGGVVAGAGADVSVIVHRLSGEFNFNTGASPAQNNGVVIAWGRPSSNGPFVYRADTDSLLAISPVKEEASVVWANEDGRHGVSYKHGTNAGFVEVAGVTVTGSSVSVQSPDRIIPDVDDVAIITPVNRLTAQFTAGPNPVSRTSSGAVSFFWQGGWIDNAVLTIFDASGNVVNRVNISDDNGAGGSPTAPAESRRIVGTWDLTDRNGRPVSEGTYLVRGTITTSSGNRERVSLVLGVR